MNPLYYRLPRQLKPAAVGAVALWKGRKKYGPDFRRHFAFLSRRDASAQRAHADEAMAAFLARVRAELPLYRVPPSLDVREMEVLTKARVVERWAQLAWDSAYATVKSSGTTGRPLAVPYTRSAYQKEYAFWWYHRSFGGVRRGDRVATFAGHRVVHIDRDRPPFWVFNPAENQLIFSSYHFHERHMPAFVDALERFRPDFIHGYPSSIYLVARHLLESGRRPGWRPKMIAAASETTLDFQRAAIEAAFGCKLYVWYGNTEFAGHAEECARGRLHLQPYHSHARIVGPDGRDVAPGEEGRIVATNWTNTAFPLINYDTRDVARLSATQTCGCEMAGPILDYILGRVEDYVYTADGRAVGRLDHLFKDAEHVRNGQIEQVEAGALIVRVEREPGYSAAVEATILAEARNRLGRDVRVTFDYVDEIPKNKNGKFKFVIQRAPRIAPAGSPG